MESVTNQMLQSKYSKYSQAYDDGTRFLPKAAKISLFWEMYPNGAIITPLPTKDITGEGIVATCQVYRDSANKETSLLADTYARRSTATIEDAEEGTIELYAAAQADAVSKALALAGVNIPIDEIYKDILSVTPKTPDATVPEELVIENGAPVEEPIPPAPEAPVEPEAPKPEETPVENASPTSEDATVEDETPTVVAEEETTEPVTEVAVEEVPAPETEAQGPVEEPVVEENIEEPEQTETNIEEPDVSDIPDPNSEPVEAEETAVEVEEPVKDPKEEKKTKASKKKTTKTEEPEETPVPAPVSPAPVNDNDETEASLIKELGISYEEALEIPFRHQTREGKLGDLLNDNTSKCLLKWMGNPTATFRKKNTRQSKIAQIIVLHNSLS